MPRTQTLHHSRDAFGDIYVKEDSHYRVLAFADDDEQSRVLKQAPDVLQHEYTQAMLLGLLFCQPKRVLVLGLGGGCLVTALHWHAPTVKIVAVELRPAVVELASRYFYLPQSKRIQVLTQDAAHYLKDVTQRKVDIIFTDLYHATGMNPLQLQSDYLMDCAMRLKSHGWLVVNCWREGQNEALLTLLRHHFVDIRVIATQSGNWVIFAGKVKDEQNASKLKRAAQLLSAEFGYAFVKHLSRLFSV